MKKIILSMVAIMAFGFANAQDKKEAGEGFAKGNIFLSGTLNVTSSKTGDFKTNDLTVAPAIGFFVSDNIAVGARLGISSGKVDNGATTSKTSGFNAEVFGRYYTTPMSKFSVFGELAIGLGSEKTTPPVGDSTTEKTFGVNAGLGINYFLSSNWAMEAGWAGLGYNTNDNGGNGADKTNTFGLNLDLSSINFGLLYKF